MTVGIDTPLQYKTLRNADFKGDDPRVLQPIPVSNRPSATAWLTRPNRPFVSLFCWYVGHLRDQNNFCTEVELVVEGRVLLRFASAYGFRNIQTLTRKLKTPKVSGQDTRHSLSDSMRNT